ncbi:MAG: restriction endonuclease [Allosphingosinicella sp.]
MNSRIRTCFITAPAGSNLDVLTDALQRRNIQVVIPGDVPPGPDLGTEVGNLLSGVDLVIGVLTRERRSEWVLFDLGQAWAKGKRILLFAPPNSAHLPSTLRRFLTVRANLSNREAIEFAIDQLLAAPEATSSAGTPHKETRPLGTNAVSYLQGSFALKTPIRAAELEQLVADALREAGVDVVVTAQDRDYGVDLALWSDAWQQSVGNPLMVEIKARLPTQRAVADAAQMLAKHVAASGNRWGLLLFGEGPKDLRSLPPTVLALPIDALFTRLQHESFEDIVRDLRNRRVHGASL